MSDFSAKVSSMSLEDKPLSEPVAEKLVGVVEDANDEGADDDDDEDEVGEQKEDGTGDAKKKKKKKKKKKAAKGGAASGETANEKIRAAIAATDIRKIAYIFLSFVNVIMTCD
jgi:hypothetical protein